MRIITDGKKLRGEAMPDILAAFQRAALGRRITLVGYLQYEEEGSKEVWPCLGLDNGTFLIVQCDDEGNGPGVVRLADADQDLVLPQTEAK